MLFVVAVAFGFMALRSDIEEYLIIWEITYKLAYADYGDIESREELCFFVLASVVLPMILLNLLIAIMSDSYDKV